jgi:acid stress-induced BolA-like protein IbaG/YrbA
MNKQTFERIKRQLEKSKRACQRLEVDGQAVRFELELVKQLNKQLGRV